MTPIVGNIKNVDVIADCLSRYGSVVLATLLQDRTTGKNIVWADGEYSKLGEGYGTYDEITIEKICGGRFVEPRVAKAVDQQAWRTKEKAEVFTPSWLCKQMVDCLDDAFFGVEPSGFEPDAETGLTEDRIVALGESGRWKEYVDNRLLEITCGEAPFVCSPYDATTGDVVPVAERMGFLDRKLRVVGRFAKGREEWLEWAMRAVENSYGYEYQGDNLLIARINVLNTVADYMNSVWNESLCDQEALRFAEVISWNLWQMDGLRGCAPSEWDLPPEPSEADAQLSFFDMGLFEEETPEEEDLQTQMQFAEKCTIYDWRASATLQYESLSKGAGSSMKKFYGIIGNPPFDQSTLASGENGQYAPPMYDKFMEASYEVGEKVELVHPARFLFNAGSTPKPFNKRRLSDPHFKVLHYEPSSKKMFNGIDLMGGVAVTYRDETSHYGAIGVFTQFEELNSIKGKVVGSYCFLPVSDAATTAYAYHFTEALYVDFPELRGRLSRGHEYDLKTNVLEVLPEIFHVEKASENEVRIFGRVGGSRAFRWVNRDYVSGPENMDAFKVFLSAADGAAGTIGKPIPARVIGTPVLGEPGTGSTESFGSIGCFETELEAINAMKYIKTRFARVLLGALKVTQHITPEKWKLVPLQDFTPGSDIDWSKSISEIDQQLYAKYGLSQEEIDFIESHVKEMS